MTDHESAPSRPSLDPIERISEVLFGLIMVLTFTGSLSVTDAGEDDVRFMLLGALGCNLAWGIIDAVIFLMGALAEKGRRLMLHRALRATSDPARTRKMFSEAIPHDLASVVSPAEIDSFCERLKKLPDPPRHARLDRRDWSGALFVFLWVFLSTFPVVIPFLIMNDVAPAKRVSDVIAIGLLFYTGRAYGRLTGRSPWKVGIAMVLLGLFLVGMTIYLGG